MVNEIRHISGKCHKEAKIGGLLLVLLIIYIFFIQCAKFGHDIKLSPALYIIPFMHLTLIDKNASLKIKICIIIEVTTH